MSRPINWLLAGAALTLFAGAGAALADDAGAAHAMAMARADAAEAQAAAARSKAEKAREKAERVERRAHVRRVDSERHFVSRTDHLRDLLQIRPEQEPALKAYVEATKGDHPRDHLVRVDRASDKSTLERLDEMESRMAEQQAAMKARIAATRAFYSQLDARQKKAFDAMPMMMMAGPHIGPTMIPLAFHHHGPGFGRHMPAPPPPPAPPVPPTPPSPPSDL